MWHYTIVKDIDWKHYLNDVFKLDGKSLEITLEQVLDKAPSIYNTYVKGDASRTGNLARAVMSCGLPPFAYIPPPLTETIDEIDWAITHGYVHPRDVIVFNIKGSAHLLNKVSMDFLKSFDTSKTSDRIAEYIENEINFRQKKEETFIVTPCVDYTLVWSKQVDCNSSGESKAAKMYFATLAAKQKDNTITEEEPRNSRTWIDLRGFRPAPVFVESLDTRYENEVLRTRNNLSFEDSAVNVSRTPILSLASINITLRLPRRETTAPGIIHFENRSNGTNYRISLMPPASYVNTLLNYCGITTLSMSEQMAINNRVLRSVKSFVGIGSIFEDRVRMCFIDTALAEIVDRYLHNNLEMLARNFSPHFIHGRPNNVYEATLILNTAETEDEYTREMHALISRLPASIRTAFGAAIYNYVNVELNPTPEITQNEVPE